MSGQNLKLSIGVTIDPSGAKSGGVAAQQAVAAIGNEAERTATKLQTLINASVGLNTGAANQNMREWTGALAAQGKSLDDLRAKYNPLFAVIRDYKSSLTEIRTLHAQGALSVNEMTAAIGRERQATLASIEAIKGRRALSDSAVGFRRQNLGYQLTDVVQSGALGAPVGMIAAQQLPQIAQIYAGQGGGVKTLLTDISALATGAVSAVGALPLALAAAGAAAILYDRNVSSSAAQAEKALEKHEETLKRIKGLFDQSGGASERYGQRVQSAINFQGTSDRTSLEEALAAQTQSVGKKLLNAVPRGAGAAMSTLYGPYLDAVQHFIAEAQQGRGDIAAFNDEINRIGNEHQGEKGIQKIGQRLLEVTKDATGTLDAIRELNEELARTTLQTSRTDAAAASLRYQIENADALADLKRKSAADLSSIGARSPAEQAEAARARVHAEPVDPRESVELRTAREESAATLARTQAERQLKDAQEERARSLETSLKSKQLELTLIGKTVSETERLRMEQQLIAQLEAEAARNHTEVDPQEIAAIKEKAAAYGQLAEQIAAANAIRAHDETILQLRTEISLVGASEAQRRRSLAALQAEQEIRQQGISAGSQEADQIRQRVRLESDLTSTLQKQEEAWGKVRQAGEDTIDSLVDGLADGDISGAIEDVAKDISKTFLELAVKNPLKNALLGTDYGTLDDIGGLGGIFSKLFGKGGNTTADVLGKTVGSMSVNAGTVMINGGVSGGLGGIANSIFGGSANDNASISKFATAIKSIESGGNYSALGPLTASGDRAYGAYQVMGANIPSWTKSALGYSLSPSQFLSNSSAQDAVFAKYFGASVSKFGNPQDAASVWFTGRPQSAGGNASDILGTTGNQYVQKFNTALGKLGNTAAGATQNLGQFGNGLGQLGQSLSTSFFPQAPSSGGSWFSKLFGGLFGGGLTSYGTSMLSTSAQFSSAWSSGGFGLYDRGGWTGEGGVNDPAGVVHKGEIVWSQKNIADAGGPAVVEAMRLGKRGYSAGGMGGGGSFYFPSSSQERSKIEIHNYNGSQIQSEERTDDRGGRTTKFIVADAVGDALATKGGGASKTLEKQFNVRRRGIAR